MALATTALRHVLTERGDYAAATDVLEQAVRLGALQGAISVEHSEALTERIKARYYAAAGSRRRPLEPRDGLRPR